MKKYIFLRKTLLILVLIPLLFLTLPARSAEAADFVTSIDLTYSVDSSGIMSIKEVRTIKNMSSKFYIPRDSSEKFIISSFKTRSESSKEDLEKVAKTISLTDISGNKLAYETKIDDKKIELTTKFKSNVVKGSDYVYVLEYKNFELVSKSGNVWNVYIPGLPKGHANVVTYDSGATSETKYSVTLELDKTFDKPNFVLPEDHTFSQTDRKNVYKFDISALTENSGWIQIGDLQYYKFKITQPVKASKELSAKIFNVFYDLVLPRESDSGNQKVYFKSIIPDPVYVKEDGEGNVIARFSFTNEEESEITVEGYIVTNITKEINRKSVGDVDEIDLKKAYSEEDGEKRYYEDLLNEASFWEVNEPEIQTAAEKIKGDKTNVYDIVLADYNFVTENVDYDNLKTGINNQRQGALATLEGGSSVCMEYSDLLITLLRAQGIPARAAFGYGFDPKAEEETEEGHQWVEVFMPNIGWVPVDPTWGDTGRRNYIGSDLDHALWRVTSIDVETPSPITKYSVDSLKLDPPTFQIEIVNEVELSGLQDLSSLQEKFEYTSKHMLLEKIDQLNVYGKIVFIGVPIVLVIVLMIIVFYSITKMIKKMTSKNFVHAKPASHDVPNNPYY
ncbi:MAG: transglutaminase domain-containing protein [Candidatus Dojkabacteria bacterium]|nr:transglutaminase domain-containing protein [Candidatus Dojkabacteria bacterium]